MKVENGLELNYMRIYNSLSRRKEDLPVPHGRRLKFFVCGPTVYDYPHIGNARTFVFFDSFVKYLRSTGTAVFYLQNITDIDDRIIERARQNNMDWKEVSRRFESIFLRDMAALNVNVDKYARATDYIPQIVLQVKTLLDKGFAYKIEGEGYYFDIAKFPDYGKLSGRTAEQAEDAVSRIDESSLKRNRGDFALWKFSDKDQPGWQTELGFGRPGWHIEDTAISQHFFGPQYDMHGGAMDLKFPHHEAEIAQQEAASGLKPFVKLWMHSGFLTVNGQKMSKSLNNFISAEELLKKYPGDIFRMAVFMHRYREPMDYSSKLIATAAKNLNDIYAFLAKLNRSGRDAHTPSAQFETALRNFTAEFAAALADDFNSPAALAAVFTFMSALQADIWQLSPRDARAARQALKTALESAGFRPAEPRIPWRVRWSAWRRESARKSQQFVQADALRKKAEVLGYSIDDTPHGPFIWPKLPEEHG